MSVGTNPDVSLTSTAFASSVSSSTFCDGEAITFTATSTSGISTYTFMVGGASQKTGPSNTFSPAAFSSTVSVAVRVETAAGCTATDTLDLFYNDIDVTGTIGQVSATFVQMKLHRHLPMMQLQQLLLEQFLIVGKHVLLVLLLWVLFQRLQPRCILLHRRLQQLPFTEGLLLVHMEEQHVKNIVI